MVFQSRSLLILVARMLAACLERLHMWCIRRGARGHLDKNQSERVLDRVVVLISLLLAFRHYDIRVRMLFVAYYSWTSDHGTLTWCACHGRLARSLTFTLVSIFSYGFVSMSHASTQPGSAAVRL